MRIYDVMQGRAHRFNILWRYGQYRARAAITGAHQEADADFGCGYMARIGNHEDISAIFQNS